MPTDRKRKRPKKDQIDSPEIPNKMASTEDLFVGFTSNALFPAQRFGDPPLQFPLPSNLSIKQEPPEDDSDDSTETVIRGETNSDRTLAKELHDGILDFHQRMDHQNVTSGQISIKTEPLEEDHSSHVPPVEAPKETQKLIETPHIPSFLVDSYGYLPFVEQKNGTMSEMNRGKIKTEPVAVSPPATTLKENKTPLKSRTSPKQPNSLCHSQESQEQRNLTPISSSDVLSLSSGQEGIKKELASPERNDSSQQKDISSSDVLSLSSGQEGIKKELASPERNDSSQRKDITSPINDVRSTTCSSIEKNHPPPSKAVPVSKSPLCDPNRNFSRDSSQFLLLGVDFNLEDIDDCIEAFSVKYPSYNNLGETPVSSKVSNNMSSSFASFEKEKSVSPRSICNTKLPETQLRVSRFSNSYVNVPSSFETTSVDTNYSKIKQINLEKNKVQPKLLTFPENSTHLKDASKYLNVATAGHAKNALNSDSPPEKFQLSKFSTEVSDKFDEKKSISVSLPDFSSEKLGKALKSASSAIFSSPPRSHESPIIANDSPSVSSADHSSQVDAVASKKQTNKEIDVRNLQENNTFINSKSLQLPPFPKDIFRKEPLTETARSKNTESGGHKKVNHRNSSDSKEHPSKKIKIADYQNKSDRQRTQPSSFVERSVECIRETPCSPLASCYLPSVPTLDRVQTSTSSVSGSSKQNVIPYPNSSRYIHSQSDAVPRDPRLRRNIAAFGKPLGLQTATAGTIPPILSPSKEVVNIQKHTSSSRVTGTNRKSYQRHEEASRNQSGHSSGPSAESSPRSRSSGLSRLHNSQPVTSARDSQTKTGGKFIPAQDISFSIIKWKATWLLGGEIPPLCKQIGKVVQESYENFAEYYDTYYGLHMLSIWLDMYESWKELNFSFCAEFESYEDRTFHYKNFCNASMPFAAMPINQGIIHITYTTEKEVEQSMFGFVYEVKQRVFPGISANWRDVKFSFYTVVKLGAKLKSSIRIRKLNKVRVAIKQLASLESLAVSPMQEVLLNPKKHSKQIDIVEIPSTATAGTELESYVNSIIECATSPDNRFTLVIQPADADTLAILSLVRSFLPKRSTVLVCLRDTERCFKIAQYLQYGFVLALKESEIADIPEEFKEFTLHRNAAKLNTPNLEAAELEVLRTAKIILTVTSRIFLGDNRNATLGQRLTVIIEHSNLCTELETALPLSYGPQNIVLLGDPKVHLNLNPHLQLREYHKSLFHRLYEGKTL